MRRERERERRRREKNARKRKRDILFDVFDESLSSVRCIEILYFLLRVGCTISPLNGLSNIRRMREQRCYIQLYILVHFITEFWATNRRRRTMKDS